MVTQKILLPYNFTPYEQKALDFVIQTFGHRKDIKVTLFNTYAPLPQIDTGANPEMQKLRGPMISLSQELKEKEAGLEAARGFLLENGFSGEQVDCIFRKREKGVAEAIVETTREGHYRVLVLNRIPGGVSRFFSRSVHGKVLAALKDVAVCVVS